jgi:hypothetical protein
MESSDLIAGKIGNGYQFLGADWIDLGTNKAIVQNVSQVTMSAWIYPISDLTSTNENNFLFASVNSSSNTTRLRLSMDSSERFKFHAKAGDSETLQSINESTVRPLNTWYYVAATVNYASDDMRLYVNGSEVLTSGGESFTAAASGNSPSASVEIGSQSRGGIFSFNKNMDEARISTGVVRSADWIATEYNNQNSPSTFYSVGSEIIN